MLKRQHVVIGKTTRGYRQDDTWLSAGRREVIWRIALPLLLCIASTLSAQQKYFVDGFHGGVYGHYPMQTYTQFMVDQLEQHPDWFIGLEIEPETWDTVKVKTPEAYLNFQRVAGSRQVEFTNPSYGQSYLYCIDGESVIRQFQYGIRKVREHFPDARIETYACEEPCFTSCLPTVLPMFGFRYLSLKCPDTCWGGYAANFGGEFVNLIGPDGTSMPCVPRYECEDLQPKSVWQTTAWSNNPSFWKACKEAGIEHPVGMCYQDAGWTKGPWIGYGNIRYGTQYTMWSDYFRRYLPSATLSDHRLSIEDVRPGLMWGSQILQRLAQQCRRCEVNMLRTEKLLAISRLANSLQWDQTQIDEGWRELLLSQHHDCWIVPYNRLNSKGNWAENVALWTADANSRMEALCQQVKESFAKRFNSGEDACLLVNTSGSKYKGVIETELKGRGRCNMEVDIPAFGYQLIPCSRIKQAQNTNSIRIKKHECLMENDQYRICFDLEHGGVITSLKDKTSNYDYAAKQGEYRMGELRGLFMEDSVYYSTKQNRATATVKTDNELCQSITISTRICDTDVRITYAISKGSKVIDCQTDVLWQRNHRIGKMYNSSSNLNMLFATSFSDGAISKAAPFDVCESALSSTEFDDWHNIKHNLINEWLDVASPSTGKSLAVLCDHTTSYSYSNDTPLSLTMQYSGGGLWGRNYKITGPTSIHYAIVPHEGKWDTANIWTLSNQWAEKPLVVTEGVKTDKIQEHSFLDLTGTGSELTSVTLDKNQLKARIFNASTKEGRFKITEKEIR